MQRFLNRGLHHFHNLSAPLRRARGRGGVAVLPWPTISFCAGPGKLLIGAREAAAPPEVPVSSAVPTGVRRDVELGTAVDLLKP